MIWLQRLRGLRPRSPTLGKSALAHGLSPCDRLFIQVRDQLGEGQGSGHIIDQSFPALITRAS